MAGFYFCEIGEMNEMNEMNEIYLATLIATFVIPNSDASWCQGTALRYVVAWVDQGAGYSVKVGALEC